MAYEVIIAGDSRAKGLSPAVQSSLKDQRTFKVEDVGERGLNIAQVTSRVELKLNLCPLTLAIQIQLPLMGVLPCHRNSKTQVTSEFC